MIPPVIIGGGISGLMAAIHLAERGLKPILLEADPAWIGGRLKDGPPVTLEHHSKLWRFPGEHAIHGLWSPYVNLKALLRRYDILPELIPAREEIWVYGRGKRIRRAAIGSAIRDSRIPAPFHYLQLFIRPRFLNILNLRDLAGMFRVWGGLAAAMSIDPLAEHKSLAGMSLADFMAGWSPTVKSLFAGLTRNALAAHPDQVPASGFIAFLRFYTLLRRDAWHFDYLPGPGGTCIAQPLAEVARRLGCEIRQGARVVNLQAEETDDRQALAGQPPPRRQVIYEAEDACHTLESRYLILAVDAPAAKQLLTSSQATGKEAAALYFPTGVATAVIRLWFKRQPKRLTEAGIFTGDFVMDNFFWLNRLQPAYVEWSRQTGGSAIEMHIYGPPELLARPDAVLLAQVILDVYRAYPELRRQLLHSVLLRNQPTQTLFGVGPPGQHLGVETPWPGIFACGDWVYHPVPALYLERAAATGMAAANLLLAQLNMEPRPVLPHPRPEWLAGKMVSGLQTLRRTLTERKRAKKNEALQ